MKYNRNIDENRMNLSKSRTIDNCMERITSEKTFWSFFKPIKLKLVMTVFTVAILITVILVSNQNNPVTPPTLSEFQTKKLVETSYMSFSIISNVIDSTETTPLEFTPLDFEETEFEKSIEDFNYYFNMLKVFIDDDTFVENALFETLDDSSYDYKIIYSVENKDYVFYLRIDNENDLFGEITVDNQTLIVEGSYEENEDEFKLNLIAKKNEDFIIVEYKSETKDEVEKKYSIKQKINNVYLEKEIVIEKEADEVKVEIKQGNDSYKLEMYSKNGVTVYYLEYEVHDLDGEVYITENIDEFGKTIYSYHITEDGIERDIDIEDPDDEDVDEDEDEDEDDGEEDKDKDLTNSYEEIVSVI